MWWLYTNRFHEKVNKLFLIYFACQSSPFPRHQSRSELSSGVMISSLCWIWEMLGRRVVPLSSVACGSSWHYRPRRGTRWHPGNIVYHHISLTFIPQTVGTCRAEVWSRTHHNPSSSPRVESCGRETLRSREFLKKDVSSLEKLIVYLFPEYWDYLWSEKALWQSQNAIYCYDFGHRGFVL